MLYSQLHLIPIIMDSYFGFNEIKALQELICPTKDQSDSEDDLSQAAARKLGPGDIAPVKADSIEYTGPHAILKGEGDDIWHPSEVSSADNIEISDPRAVPEYEIKFKQQVTTEDIFLGMGFKTPSTASCEWLSIFIKLPGEMMENVELSVESEWIDIRSPKYRLHLATPHPVNPNASTANWHIDSSMLELTLKMSRELDVVNF